MQFLRGDGGNLGGNGSNNVGINPLDTLTLTFIMFVSVESKYFDGAVFFRLLRINFCVFIKVCCIPLYGCGILR